MPRRDEQKKGKDKENYEGMEKKERINGMKGKWGMEKEDTTM
jgi:hypothetical protein